MSEPIIMPIEIRPDYFVQIMGIPHDLTTEEARKIASVVLALAAAGYVVAPSTDALLQKGRDAGVKLIPNIDTTISEETKAALAAIDKDTKFGL